jgi:hypothetical protein
VSDGTICQSADCHYCRTPAVRYVSCEGEGSYPYCRECADVLIRVGEIDRGPVIDPDPCCPR